MRMDTANLDEIAPISSRLPPIKAVEWCGCLTVRAGKQYVVFFADSDIGGGRTTGRATDSQLRGCGNKSDLRVGVLL